MGWCEPVFPYTYNRGQAPVPVNELPAKTRDRYNGYNISSPTTTTTASWSNELIPPNGGSIESSHFRGENGLKMGDCDGTPSGQNRIFWKLQEEDAGSYQKE